MTTQVGTDGEHRRNSHELWERMATSWERHRELGWRSTRDVSEWLVERVDPTAGETLLELGAGTGARRVLRPGGRLAFSTWGKAARNPWMTFSAQVMIEHGLLASFSSEGPGVFAMPDAEAILPLLAEAGFGEVEVEEMALSWRLEDADELWIFVSELQGPVAVAIGKLEDEKRRALQAVIEERASAFAAGDGYELPGLSINVAAAAG
jgi:hypothetical protein